MGVWTYKENKIITTASTLTISGTGSIDELRLYPVGAQMKSLTYSPLMGATSINDPNSEITYYDYDNFQRLRNIKDYQGNIIKNFQYNYAQPCTSCSVAMKTFAGTPTISYPVGVFAVDNKLIGNASTQIQYVSLWNSYPANQTVATLSAGADSMHFILAMKAGQSSPGFVTGCRYYQYDLAFTQFDAVIFRLGCYVDFGDGTGMQIGKSEGDL